MLRKLRLAAGVPGFAAVALLLVAACAGTGNSSLATPPPAPRIKIDRENPRYFEWGGELVYLIGATETGPESCGTGNGWLAISSDFDWQPDLENLISHGGNYARVVPYFPGHPVMPWLRESGELYDLRQINPDWVQRLRDYLTWTEANGVVVQLEVFENYSFSNNTAWQQNPWNPNMNVNYESDQIPAESQRADIAMYKALTNNRKEVIDLLEHYVAILVLESMSHGNVIYSVSNESNAPLEWAEYWADYIHKIASSRGFRVLVGEMPHAAEPTTGIEAIAASRSFDFVDVSSYTSEDQFGENDVTAIVAGTDQVLTDLSGDGKPMTAAKIYYRAPATLWSKFMNGTASARFHRNCDRGGTNEENPEVYFEYVQHLRSFINELDLTQADTIDDGIVSGMPEGVQADVLGATDKWYVIHLYKEDADLIDVSFRFERPPAGYSYRWFNPATGEWLPQQAGSTPNVSGLLQAPEFESTLVLFMERQEP